MAAEAASDKTKVVAAMAIRVLTGLLLLVFRTTVRAAPADAGVAADVADSQSKVMDRMRSGAAFVDRAEA